MLLIKLLDSQISAYWDILKFALENSLPPTADETPEKMNNILQSLLLGKLQAWVLSDDVEVQQVKMVVFTRISIDESSETSQLLLYALYSFTPLDAAGVDTMYRTLFKFAKHNKCNRAVAYSDNPNMISVAAKYGMFPTHQFLVVDLNNPTVKI